MLHEIDFQVYVGLIQRYIIDKAEGVYQIEIFGIDAAESSCRSLFDCFMKVVEQQRVIARFGSQNEPYIMLIQVLDMGRIRTESVFYEDHRQPWEVGPELWKEPLCGIALAIALGRSVLRDNHLWRKWNDLLKVGVHQSDGQYLLMMCLGAITVILGHAGI
jgi:hypothetical protein